MKIALCADIGGTHAKLNIIKFIKNKPKILFTKYKPTAEIKNIITFVNSFLDYAKKRKLSPKIACFAVAGPMKNQKIKMTNTKLIIDAQEIRKNTSLKEILLINDFDAIGYALNFITKKDLKTLNLGRPLIKGTRTIIGAGTGLGKNILIFDHSLNSYIPHPSEGGHSDLPLLDENELKLSQFVRKKRKIKGNIAYEDVLSGAGLENIYHFLKKTKFLKAPTLNSIEISKSRKTNSCSKETFEYFIRFYARCARNFVLDTLSTGGLYLAGGIAVDNRNAFSKNFFKEFINNVTYKDLLKKIPIHIITNTNISNMGAAHALLLKKGY